MTVEVPADLAQEMGVRPLLDATGVKDIFEILSGESSLFDKVWSRRFKDYTERLSSGDVVTTAGLVRDISRRNHESRVSYGEMGVLRSALAPLLAELALAMGTEKARAAELVDAAVLERRMPTLDEDGMILVS